MEIVICDDEEYMLENIEQVCMEALEEEAHTTCYLSSEELMYELKMFKPHVDVFVLDIEMPRIDGFELKDEISRLYRDTNILFVTSHDELVYEAFGYKVVGFIPKENYEEKLIKKLKEVKEELEDNALIAICDNNDIHEIHTNEIFCIEARKEYTMLYKVEDYNLDGGIVKLSQELLRIKLKDWEAYLKKYDFYKVNRSSIVNLKYVKFIEEKLIMDDRRSYAIPVGSKKNLIKTYKEYRRKRFKCL